MSKKISELDTATEANNEDVLILNQSDETKQISKEDLFANTEGNIGTLNTKVDNLLGAEEYDSEYGTYSVGDYCVYEGLLYVCTTAILQSEDFDSEKWQQATIIDLPAKEFINEVTFSETHGDYCEFFKRGNTVFIRYQGQAKTYNSNDVIFTLPEEYAPKLNSYFPFVKGYDGDSGVIAYGLVKILTNGLCQIANKITTSSGRIYFTAFYLI